VTFCDPLVHFQFSASLPKPKIIIDSVLIAATAQSQNGGEKSEKRPKRFEQNG